MQTFPPLVVINLNSLACLERASELFHYASLLFKGIFFVPKKENDMKSFGL